MASSQYHCNDQMAASNLIQKELRQLPPFTTFSAIFNGPSPLYSQPRSLSRPDLTQTSQSTHNVVGDSSLFSTLRSAGESKLASPSSTSSLFEAGFQDCASEVIRFLNDQEKMDSRNPLLNGLKSHLVNVCNSMSEMEQSTVSSPTKDSPHNCDLSARLQSLSPVFTKPVSSSNIDNVPLTPSFCASESEIISKGRKRSSSSTEHLSPSQYSQTLASSLTSSCSPPSPFTLQTEDTNCSHTPAKRSRHTYPCGDNDRQIPSLSCLANNAISGDIDHVSNNKLSPRELDYSQPQHGIQTKSVISSLPLTSSPMASFNMFRLSLDSPIPTQIKSSLSTSSSSDFSFQEEMQSDYLHLLPSSSTSSLSSPSLSSQLPSTTVQIPDVVNDIPQLSADSEDVDYTHVLQSVKSCQSHEDPKVRDLAAKIINLIHDVDYDDDYVDDDEDDEIEDENDCDRDIHEFEDSGIDLGLEDE